MEQITETNEINKNINRGREEREKERGIEEKN